MPDANVPVLVIEDDPFPRILQVILDRNPPAGRRAAFAHLAAHELQDFEGWCERMRDSARGLYPAEARLVSSQEELRANLRDATVVTETGEQQFMNALTGAARRRPAVRIRAH